MLFCSSIGYLIIMWCLRSPKTVKKVHTKNLYLQESLFPYFHGRKHVEEGVMGLGYP